MADLIWCEAGTAATRGLEWFDASGGTVATESSTVKYGQRSIKFTANSGAFLRKDGVLADAGRRITFWFRLSALPTTNPIRILSIQTSGNNPVLYLLVTTAGKLSLANNEPGASPSSKTGTFSIAGATWYRVAISYTITSTTNWQCKVYASDTDGAAGTLDINASNTDFSLANTGSYRYSPVHTSAVDPSGCDVFFGPSFIDNGTDLNDPGDIRVIPALYDAENTNNFDTAVGNARGSTDYNNVNERPLSETNGWLHQGTSAMEESYIIEQTLTSLDVDLTGKTIVGRMAWLWATRGNDTFTPCTHRAAASGTGNTTTGGTMTIPASVVSGDMLYVGVTSQGSTSASADVTCTDNDTGGNTWTVHTNTSDKKSWVFKKRATSGTASKTVTIANGVTKTAFGCVVVKDAYTGGTAETNTSTETNASGDETHAGFTPDLGGSLIMFFVFDYGSNNDASSQSTANLGAMTERVSHLPAGPGADCALAIATLDGTAAAAAATGNITWAQTNSTTYSVAFAVRPEGTWAAAAVKLINNGTDVAKTLTLASGLYTDVATSATYPSGAFGMKSSGNDEDTYFYEGGCLIVYQEPAPTTDVMRPPRHVRADNNFNESGRASYAA